MDPSANTIDPTDLAHALGFKCRFTGHTAHFYSVAEHSVMVSDWMELEGYSQGHQRWALLHDMSEAYLPDVASPIKALLKVEVVRGGIGHQVSWGALEAEWQEACRKRFKLPQFPQAVHQYDALAFHYEASVLIEQVAWRQKADLQGWEGLFNKRPLEGLSPLEARWAWVKRFNELFPGERVHIL